MKVLATTKIIVLFMLFSLAGYIYAGGITTIHQINASPANFDGRTVQLQGITKKPTRIPIIDLKAYVLEDNTGEIIILTNDNLPEMGQMITVRVHIENLAIINGEALGTTVVELHRFK